METGKHEILSGYYNVRRISERHFDVHRTSQNSSSSLIPALFLSEASAQMEFHFCTLGCVVVHKRQRSAAFAHSQPQSQCQR